MGRQDEATFFRKIPGLGKQLENADIDDRQIDWCEAIIYSMTPAEREKPSLINASRKKRIAAGSGRKVEEVNRLLKRKRRIAAGSGTKVEDVNQLLRQFEQMQKMMKQFTGKGKKGKRRAMMKGMPNLNELGDLGNMGGNGMPPMGGGFPF